MIVSGKNFTRQAAPTVVAARYENCNFTQAEPGTRIFPDDDTPREFVECNLTNAVPPSGSELTRCNTTQVRRQVQDGSETVTIADKTVQSARYVDRVLGRLDPKTLRLERKEHDIEIDPPEETRDGKIKRLVRQRDAALAEAARHEAEAIAVPEELEHDHVLR